MSSVLMNQQYTLNKMSLNRKTHKITFYIYQWARMCEQRLTGTEPCVSPGSNGTVITSPVFMVTS